MTAVAEGRRGFNAAVADGSDGAADEDGWATAADWAVTVADADVSVAEVDDDADDGSGGCSSSCELTGSLV